MVTRNKYVEIEVGCGNRKIYFKPICKALRGRMDFSDSQSESDQKARARWPEPCPGERICIDFATGEKFTRDPLYDEEHEAIRRRIGKRDNELPPRRVNYESESVVTWVYHLHRLIDAGYARVVEGELPDWQTFDEKPKKRFITDPGTTQNELIVDVLGKLLESVQANTAMLNSLAERIGGKQSPAGK